MRISPFPAVIQLVRYLTIARGNTTPSAIRIWGLAFALTDLAMSGSHLVLVWMAAFGRLDPAFDVSSTAAGFSMIMGTQWVGLAAFATALRWPPKQGTTGDPLDLLPGVGKGF